jgi:DNA-binding MarR family transcriptional regulator
MAALLTFLSCMYTSWAMEEALTDRSRVQISTMGDRCFALQARKTANLLARVYNAALEPLGVEISQFSTLCALALEQSDSITELAAGLGVERSTLTRNLKVLERDDLIALSEREGRRSRYRLTPKGRRMLSKALPIWSDVQVRVAAALSDAAPNADPRTDLRLLRRAARAIGPRAG